MNRVTLAVERLNFLADIFGSSEGTDVFGKEAIKSQSRFQKETLTAPKLWRPQRGVAVRHPECTYTSHVPHEVLVGLLGVPLLPLLAGLHLGQQRLSVRLVGFDDVL